MIGFPKNLNTKADYEYVRQHFTPELWRPKFQELLDTEKDWFFVKELTSRESGYFSISRPLKSCTSFIIFVPVNRSAT